MSRADRGASSSGAGKGQKRGKKITLGGTLFAFASMLVGNWLDKKLSQRKEKQKSESIFPESDR